MYLSRLLH